MFYAIRIKLSTFANPPTPASKEDNNPLEQYTSPRLSVIPLPEDSRRSGMEETTEPPRGREENRDWNAGVVYLHIRSVGEIRIEVVGAPIHTAGV